MARRIAGGNKFPHKFPFRFNVTITGQRIAGDNTFPYRFPFRFNASITGRTINDTS